MGTEVAAEQCIVCTVTADQEAWLYQRIKTAVRMALEVQRCRQVRADDPTFESALDGIVNGAVRAVLLNLGLRPAYTNLRRAVW
jgi:hypothetical protein